MADNKAKATQNKKGTQRQKDAPRRQKAGRFDVDIKGMLVDGEKVVDTAEISNGIYWKAIAVLIAAILIALFIIEIGVLLAVVSLLMFAHATLTKEVLLLVLTDRRIFVRYGILQVDIVDVRFSKIESIELERMLPGYLLGYASLIISGTGNRFIVIPFVSNGVQIRRNYNKMALADEEPQEVVVVEKKAEE